MTSSWCPPASAWTAPGPWAAPRRHPAEEGVQDPNPAHAAVVEPSRPRSSSATATRASTRRRWSRWPPVAATLGLDDLEVEPWPWRRCCTTSARSRSPTGSCSSPARWTREWDLMREHPVIGERILRAIPGMGAVARIVRHEHEHFDGGGYPDGLRGEEIPIGSRIILACDTYSAMTTSRPTARRCPTGRPSPSWPGARARSSTRASPRRSSAASTGWRRRGRSRWPSRRAGAAAVGGVGPQAHPGEVHHAVDEHGPRHVPVPVPPAGQRLDGARDIWACMARARASGGGVPSPGAPSASRAAITPVAWAWTARRGR